MELVYKHQRNVSKSFIQFHKIKREGRYEFKLDVYKETEEQTNRTGPRGGPPKKLNSRSFSLRASRTYNVEFWFGYWNGLSF